MQTKEIAGSNGQTFIQTAEELFLFQPFFNLFFLHPHPLIIMSCPVESDLRRHEERLDIQAREEKHKEENPSYYWIIATKKSWTDYAYSEEEKNEMIQDAKENGLTYSCTKHIEGESYA